jgi:hypothetical protein
MVFQVIETGDLKYYQVLGPYSDLPAQGMTIGIAVYDAGKVYSIVDDPDAIGRNAFVLHESVPDRLTDANHPIAPGQE